jgi:hypothetical protein
MNEIMSGFALIHAMIRDSPIYHYVQIIILVQFTDQAQRANLPLAIERFSA